MNCRKTTLLLGLSLVLCAQWALAGLQEYVDKPDEAYAYAVHSTLDVGTTTAYFVHLTSQTWRDITWKHWLTIIKPEQVEYPDKALLLISGGSNSDQPPKTDSDEARALVLVAQQLKSVVAVLEQVPNQPLFDGKHEDAIISYTFEQFLDGEAEDWPLLLPMVKSAVRAMDAIQAIAQDQFGDTVKQFMVTGASKRGWTTWLTAAVDPRVAAIAPMVIDVLNLAPQMRHQKKVYGTYTASIGDYTQRNIQGQMDTPAGKRLTALVDPYSYRESILVPKLVLLGTNDQYWTVDSAKLYFDDLLGRKYLHYVPNARHSLNLSVVPVLMTFYNALLTGERLPEYHWRTRKDGVLEVTWDHPGAKAILWRADSPNRDFRRAKWSGTPLPGKRKATAKVDPPEQGWTAYFVSVSFPVTLGGMPAQCPFSTMMHVIPDTYPEH